MAWSIQIARAFGIPIRLHLTFLILLAWLAHGAYRPGGDPSLLPVALGLFTCVVLHELGHSVTAQRFGLKVESITLLPIGGVAALAKMPREPRQELLIAIAGPAVNFVLAPLLYALHLALEATPNPETWSLASPGSPLLKLAVLNIGMAVFNLLPAFPMDGGRILRAVLALRLGYGEATRISASLGQLLAIMLGFLGLFASPMLLFIALFVFIGAAAEGARVETQTMVEGSTVAEAMMTRFFTLSRADSLGRAAELLLAGTQQDFPVVEDHRVVGILTRRRLLEGLARGGRDIYVSEAMEPAPPPVHPEDPLEEVLERLTGGNPGVVPVENEEGLCGLLTAENAGELVLVRSALRRGPGVQRGSR